MEALLIIFLKSQELVWSVSLSDLQNKPKVAITLHAATEHKVATTELAELFKIKIF